MANKSTEDDTQPIRVFVRLRPFNANERLTPCIELLNTRELKVLNRKKFNFDAVFGPETKQPTLYKMIAKPLISEVLSGYNCTVFAYGQTGTGKTFTMSGGLPMLRSYGSTQSLKINGEVLDNTSKSPLPTDNGSVIDEKSGLIPRVVTELFEELRLLQQEYTVRCSYLELYNEDLRDLLSMTTDSSRLKIYDDQRHKGAVIVQGIEEVTVHNTSEVFKLLQRGQDKRRTAFTHMNELSSRSHTVFSIIVHTRETCENGEELVKMGKLNLVDLAGSEDILRSGAVDRRAREAGNINQSLLTLGRVIKGLSDKNSHIPFRESKLTRILQDSLGGKTKTTIIATISPCVSSLDETLSTLDYAHRARVITNKPEINKRMSQKAVMNQYIEEIARLRKDLYAAKTGEGIFLDTENYEKLRTDHETYKQELLQKTSTVRELEKKIRLVEEEKRLVHQEWDSLNKSFEETQSELVKMQQKCVQIESQNREQEYLALRYEKNAENLHKEAHGLLQMVESSSFNEAILLEKVESLYTIANANNDAIKRTSTNIQQLCSAILDDLCNFMTSSKNFNKELTEMLASSHNHRRYTFRKIDDLTAFLQNHLERDGDFIDAPVDKTRENLQNWKQTLNDRFTDLLRCITDIQQSHHSEFNTFINTLVKCETDRQLEFISKLRKHLEEMNHLVVSPRQDLCSDLDTIKAEILNELDKLSKRALNRSNVTDTMLTEVGEWRDNLLKVVNSGVAMITTQLTQHKEEDLNNVSFVADVQKNITSLMPNFQRKLVAYSDNTLNAISVISDFIDENQYNGAITKIYNKEIDNYTSEMTARNNTATENLEKLFEEINSRSDDCLNDNHKILNKLQSDVNAKFESMMDKVNEQKIDVQSALIAADDDFSNINSTLEDTLKGTLDYRATMTDNVHQLESLVNYVHKDIAEVKHVGNTPTRRQYKYPTLKDLTPKDRVIMKYRQLKPGSSTDLFSQFPDELNSYTESDGTPALD